MRRFCVIAGVILLRSACAFAEPPGPDRFCATVLTTRGRSHVGRLVRLDLPGRIVLEAGDGERSLSADDVLWIGISSTASRAKVSALFAGTDNEADRPAWKWLRLRDGQVLRAGSLTYDGRMVEFISDLLGRVSVGPEAVESIDFTAPVAGRVFAGGSRGGAGGNGALDEVLLATGEVVRGVIEAIRQDSVVLLSGLEQKLTVPADAVVRIRFARTGPDRQGSGPARAVLWLRSGERLRCGRVRLIAGDSLQLSVTLTGQRLTRSLADFVGIEVISSEWQWLSLIRPSFYAHRPLLAPVLAWQADRSALGTAMRMAGSAVYRGVGVPSRSVIRYPLGGQWRSLVVWPGLDDSARPRGAVQARVLVDGAVRWQGRFVAGQPVRGVRIDVAGGQTLELIVDPDANADIQDRFNWAWAALVR